MLTPTSRLCAPNVPTLLRKATFEESAAFSKVGSEPPTADAAMENFKRL